MRRRLGRPSTHSASIKLLQHGLQIGSLIDGGLARLGLGQLASGLLLQRRHRAGSARCACPHILGSMSGLAAAGSLHVGPAGLLTALHVACRQAPEFCPAMCPTLEPGLALARERKAARGAVRCSVLRPPETRWLVAAIPALAQTLGWLLLNRAERDREVSGSSPACGRRAPLCPCCVAPCAPRFCPTKPAWLQPPDRNGAPLCSGACRSVTLCRDAGAVPAAVTVAAAARLLITQRTPPYSMHQSMGCWPPLRSSSLAWLKWRQPKKPRCALRPLGWGDASTWFRVLSITFPFSCRDRGCRQGVRVHVGRGHRLGPRLQALHECQSRNPSGHHATPPRAAPRWHAPNPKLSWMHTTHLSTRHTAAHHTPQHTGQHHKRRTCAYLPHSRNTTSLRSRDSPAMAAFVNFSQPRLAWEAAACARTVSTAQRKRFGVHASLEHQAHAVWQPAAHANGS